MIIGILVSLICILLSIIFDKNMINLEYFVTCVILFPIPAMIGTYLQGYYKSKEEGEKKDEK